MTDIDRSNSLTDLAHRIKAEHEASVGAFKRGIEHAVACGRLLIEARDQIKHGEWLPWLKDHCGVPERSARRYMELAAYAAADLKSDLALDGAAIGATPFNADVLKDPEGSFYKMVCRLNLPAIATWCLLATEIVGGKTPWILCPWDDLIETLRLLKSLVDGKQPTAIRFDTASFTNMRDMQNAIACLTVRAMREGGRILLHIDHREKIADEEYRKEWGETMGRVMAGLDKESARLQAE
jgi:hypothetical protein